MESYAMSPIRATLDTGILVSGLRSQRGASHAVLQAVVDRRFDVTISVALFLEYEDVLTRPEIVQATGLSGPMITDFLAHLAQICIPVPTIAYRWRPALPDPNDEHVLECALSGFSHYLVTHNLRDFRAAAERFGVQVVPPAQFLLSLGR